MRVLRTGEWLLLVSALGISNGCGGGSAKSDAGADAAGPDVATCPSALPDDIVEGCAVRADAGALMEPWSGSVTVTEVTQTAPHNCGSGRLELGGPSVGQATRIVVRAASQDELALFVRVPQMPANLVKVGDAFDLNAGAPTGGMQVVVLSRAGALVAFTAAYDSRQRPVRFPELESFGVTFSDGGPTCELASTNCSSSTRRIHVTKGADSADVAVGATTSVGDLTLTLEQYTTSSCLDSDQLIQLAGFVAP